MKYKPYIQHCIFISIFLSKHLFSQQYSKIPTDTNHFWKQVSTCNYRYQIRYQKDTLISGKVYNLYGLFGGRSGVAPCLGSFVKNGYLRQDTLAKKVFILDANFNERPLYNFSKGIGDTLQVYDRVSNTNVTYTVQMIFGGVQELIENGVSYHFFPGIGSHEGGLYASRQSHDPTFEVEKLVCTGIISPFQTTSPPDVGFEGQCFLSNEIKENTLVPLQFKLYPNPVKDKLTIEFASSQTNLRQISLSSTLGQVVFRLNNPEAVQNLDLRFLAAGLYFLDVQDVGIQEVFKIIKE